jgi:hypothetical protein
MKWLRFAPANLAHLMALRVFRRFSGQRAVFNARRQSPAQGG